MHSVFRIIAEKPGRKNILPKVMNDFNAIRKELFGEMKKYDAISATIYDGDCWEDHCIEIRKFIIFFSRVLKTYENEGLCYHIDICIKDYEDIKDRIVTSFVCETDFLKVLVDNNVSLEFSYYNTG